MAELIGGVLHVMPRPSPRHANAEGALQGELFGPFHRGRGGPGGWWILPEPELHFPDPDAPGEIDAAVVHRDAARVRVAPFDAIEIELAVLWAR
ncbi:hypothetical protein [Sorangium sp. So ce426]|uniref:hypothetical protein n=1 Tax=unclassified Sorangium TaxID=2621164 RepID=UPI003F5AF620